MEIYPLFIIISMKTITLLLAQVERARAVEEPPIGGASAASTLARTPAMPSAIPRAQQSGSIVNPLAAMDDTPSPPPPPPDAQAAAPRGHAATASRSKPRRRPGPGGCRARVQPPDQNVYDSLFKLYIGVLGGG